MDRDLFLQLQDAGIKYDIREDIPWVEVPASARGNPPGDFVGITDGRESAPVHLKRATELFAGNETPPSFLEGPTPEYEAFFMMMEMAALDWCDASGEVPTDFQFELAYNELRRSPDGPGRSALFPWLNVAARLYMSLVDTSRAEYDAVLRRLAKSARTWSKGPGSRDYHRMLVHFLEFAASAEEAGA